MPSKTPHTNGTDPVENGINSTKDVGMKEDTPSSMKGGKGKKVKDSDEEMTVVVPPSKGSKLSAPPPPDTDGDIIMDDSEKPIDVVSTELEIDPVEKAVSDIKNNFALLERAVSLFDARFSLRALRSISSIRKRLSPDILAQVITDTYPPSNGIAKGLLTVIGKEHTAFNRQSSSDMEIDSDLKPASKPGAKKEPRDIIPEIDIFLGILFQVYFYDTRASKKGAEFSSHLAERIHSLNRRTLDSLSARVYFYYSMFCEQLAPLPPSSSSPMISIRPTLLAALRTAVLRKDIDTQSTVIVLLLRNYLATSHITQADLLVSHTKFPENASNNQVARYLYYLGRIRAIQLRYTEAHEHLTAATRKAPSSPSAAGFSQTATKLLLVVELLMGDIPDRATFRMASLERALGPYLLLVQAVRVGNLEDFELAIKQHSDTFRRDSTYTLILRLRQNVIRTGIRMMSLSYSRISLRDICIRLHLGSEESAEYIVAKAIKDGVIEASLDRERGFMKSKEIGDVYATREPGEAFHDRIRACLALHDESVKAMRFPMNQHRLELKNAQEAREREREMAKEIQDGDLDEDDLGGEFEVTRNEGIQGTKEKMPPSIREPRGRVLASRISSTAQIPASYCAKSTICVSEFLNGDVWATMPSASARRMSVTPSVASTATTKPSTAERNIDNVVLGDIMFRAWYPSYHVKEIVGKEVVEGKKEMLERLYVCNHCFKYSKELMNWVLHVRACERRFGGALGGVPGREIYTHGKGAWSVWEVDGEADTLYCQNLSLFAKLFLDNKSVFFDVTGFYYFLLVHKKPTGEQQVIGFFSKEKMSWDNNNLACILIFPPWQRKGLGALLIGVSYEISRREEIMGGPEKPISSLGKQSYLRFWSGEIARYLLGIKETDKKRGKGMISLDQISKDTWIYVDDCLCALRYMGVAVAVGKGKGELARVRIDKEKVREWAKAKGIGLEPVIDIDGFLVGYGYKEAADEEMGD